MNEKDLYPDIEKWLNQYLTDRYKEYTIITTSESSSKTLDTVLKKYGINIDELEGLLIKVDVIGILQKNNGKQDDIKLVFVEVKDELLTLKDLGQLWGYIKLANPIESFLISSEGLGTLQIIFDVHNRTDLLVYGENNEKFMKIVKWDNSRKIIDYSTIIPKT